MEHFNTQQLPLNYPEVPRYQREDFMLSDANRDAFVWVTGWPQAWPSHGLILHGPAGCGKSHLLHIWAEQAKAGVMTPELWAEHAPDKLVKKHSCWALDHWQSYCTDAGSEEKLMHLVKLVQEKHGSLLMTSQQPVKQHKVSLPDLDSRLQMLPAVAIEAPDDELLAALFVKLLRDRQVQVQEKVVQYAIPRMQRSFAGVVALVRQLDGIALGRKQPITQSLVREVLEGQEEVA